MRISDWSSDVCSSDLFASRRQRMILRNQHDQGLFIKRQRLALTFPGLERNERDLDTAARERGAQIGIASFDDLDREGSGELGDDPLEKFARRRPDRTDPQQGRGRRFVAAEAIGGAKGAFELARSEEHTSEL